jgi:hypothetical protein
MQRYFLLWVMLAALISSSACQAGTPVPKTSALLPVCADQEKIITAFYDANQAGDFNKSLTYLTDDVVLISWAEGMNGRHLDQKSAVGKDYIGEYLGMDGLRWGSGRDPALRFKIEGLQKTGNQVFFRLMPDRLRPNGRQYNPYAVEIIFRGCQIELIKITERITWV